MSESIEKEVVEEVKKKTPKKKTTKKTTTYELQTNRKRKTENTDGDVLANSETKKETKPKKKSTTKDSILFLYRQKKPLIFIAQGFFFS